MTDDAFAARQRALENEFFRSVDKKLVERIRDDIRHARSQEELASLTGIDDAGLLDELLEIGVERDTLMAFTLIPLAFVAWADGCVEVREREAVLNTATALGYGEGSPNQALLSHWLTQQPPETLFDLWQGHATTIINHIKPASWEQLAQTIIDRAEKVAQATGGVMGLGSKSTAELTVVGKIRETLESKK